MKRLRNSGLDLDGIILVSENTTLKHKATVRQYVRDKKAGLAQPFTVIPNRIEKK